MLFRLFQVFLAYVFLSGKLADPDPLPPLLVENSTNFFFLKPSLSYIGKYFPILGEPWPQQLVVSPNG